MEERLKELYQSGKENFHKGVYKKALQLLSAFVKENKNFADAYNMLGVIYHTQEEFKKAIECFERAIEINPKYTEAAINLTVTYTELGQYKKAKEVYAKTTKASRVESLAQLHDNYAKSKIANMHAELGDIYRGMGLYDEAIEEYKKALKLKPTFVDIKTKLGVALRDKGYTGQAIKEFEEAKLIHPDYHIAGINLGITYYSLGKTKEAVEEWRAVLQRDPDNKSAQMYLRLVEKTKE